MSVEFTRNNKTYSLALERFVTNFDNSWTMPNITRRCFGYSNENLEGVYKHILSKRKNIKDALVVGSSGDQLINAIFYGAKNITLADINPMSEVVTELKIAAIKNLNFNDFLAYWDRKSRDAILDHKVYSKIFLC